MNLSKLIHEIWKDEEVKARRFTKDEVDLIVKVFIKYAVKNLLENKVLKLRGLITLHVKKSKGRRMINPQTKEEMFSKDYYRIGLKPSKELKEGLDRLRDEQ